MNASALCAGCPAGHEGLPLQRHPVCCLRCLQGCHDAPGRPGCAPLPPLHAGGRAGPVRGCMHGKHAVHAAAGGAGQPSTSYAAAFRTAAPINTWEDPARVRTCCVSLVFCARRTHHVTTVKAIPPLCRNTGPGHTGKGGGRPRLRRHGLHLHLPARSAPVRTLAGAADHSCAGHLRLCPATTFCREQRPRCAACVQSVWAAPMLSPPDPGCSTQVAVTQGAAGASYLGIVKDMMAGGGWPAARPCTCACSAPRRAPTRHGGPPPRCAHPPCPRVSTWVHPLQGAGCAASSRATHRPLSPTHSPMPWALAATR